MKRQRQVMRFLSPQAMLSFQGAMRVAPGEVHVWPFSLSGLEVSRQRCATLLSREELVRAGRFVFERDRVAFVFSHGQMRHLLALYCGTPGAALEFTSRESGKPELAQGQPLVSGISFNLTHSAGRALLAVSDGRALGVDLEFHNAKTDALALASHYFFGSEFEAIRDAPEPQRAATFFRFWTAKEAVLKAQGTGLSVPLNAFRVAFAEGQGTAHVETFDAARIDDGWFVRTLPLDGGWSGAVAAKSSEWGVRVMGQ